jgi:hypothetical protein
MKFYEIKQQLNNLYWQSLGFVKKKQEAESIQSLYNTKTIVRPTKIVEHEFLKEEDFEK